MKNTTNWIYNKTTRTLHYNGSKGVTKINLSSSFDRYEIATSIIECDSMIEALEAPIDQIYKLLDDLIRHHNNRLMKNFYCLACVSDFETILVYELKQYKELEQCKKDTTMTGRVIYGTLNMD